MTVGGRADRLPGHEGLSRARPSTAERLGPGQGRPPAALAGRLAAGEAGHLPSTRPSSAGSPAARRWPTSRSTSMAARTRATSRSTTTTASTSAAPRGWSRSSRPPTAWSSRRARRPSPGYDETPVKPRYDVVYLLDARGWYYRYSHLHTIDPAIKPGAKVKMGQRVGLLGKEGGSGGWSHLHFDITGRQPSGKWGIIEGYAFLWEAYLRRVQAEAARRGPAAPPRGGRRESRPRRQPVVVGGCRQDDLRLDLHRRQDGGGVPASSGPTQSRASTARS